MLSRFACTELTIWSNELSFNEDAIARESKDSGNIRKLFVTFSAYEDFGLALRVHRRWLKMKIRVSPSLRLS